MPKFAEREKMISFLLQPSTNSESVKELPTLLFCAKAISGPFKEFSSKNTAELKAASLTLASFKRIVYHPPHCTWAWAVNLSVYQSKVTIEPLELL